MKVAIFALLVVCLFASSVDKYVEMMGKDSCAAKVITTLKSEIETVANKGDLKNQVEILAVVSKGKEMMKACPQELPTTPNKHTPLYDVGVDFITLSNCAKDIGIECLLADEVAQDWHNVPQDVFIAIFLAILARQAVGDCEQFYDYFIHHFPFPHAAIN